MGVGGLDDEEGLTENLVCQMRRELDRELVHKVQNLRREKGFDIEETISVSLRGSPRVANLLRGPWGEYFKAEVLVRELRIDETDGAPGEPLRVHGEELWVRIERFGKVGSG